MRILSSLVAIGSLLGVVVLAPVYGAALFMLLLVGLFLLALVGVLSGVDDRTVQQRDPSMSPRAWRGDG
jgi:hypothetical protein